MANSLAYKDILVTPEATWGASLAGIPDRLHIRTSTLNLDVEKQLVEETTGTPKGRNRIISIKNTLEGEITGYLSPRNAHHVFEWVNGVLGSYATMGDSGSLVTYNQDVGGSLISKSVTIDRNNSQERFNGVRAKSLELTAADSITEFTLSAIARSKGLGASIDESTALTIGETVKPATFADWTIQINAGSTIGTAPITLLAKEWNIKYDNGLETAHLSGSATPARSDPKVPTIEGSYSIFHDGSSWVSATHGSSEFALRFQATLPSERGLIAGVTPFMIRIDIPKVQLSTNTRQYGQGELVMEETNFMAMFDTGISALWRVQITAGQSIS